MRTKVLHFVKRLFVALIAFIVVYGCIPAKKVEAYQDYYNFNSQTLKQKTWSTFKYNKFIYTENDRYLTYNMLKFKVPASGYIKIETKNPEQDTIYLTDSVQKNVDPPALISWQDEQTQYYVVSKGSYYFYTNTSSNTIEYTNIRIRWSFVKASNPSNYCRAKAKKLSRNKKEMIIFNHGYEYDRWYKIVLKKKQPITINLKCLDNGASNDDDFTVYKSCGESVYCPPLVDNTTYRTTILPKGTYYINIKHDHWGLDKRIMNFSWK